jgi:hypothetical protein
LDAFRKFDDSGIKLKELELKTSAVDKPLFIEELVRSQQSKYIQKLILEDIVPAPLEMMSNMEVLTYLKINFWDSCDEDGYEIKTTVHFNQLIKACPATLMDLIIESVKLSFSESSSNMTSIQCMTLKNVEIAPPAAITGTSFPELTVLDLDVAIYCDFTISLPNCHLKKVTIKIEYSERDECILSVNIMRDGKPQRNVICPPYKNGLEDRPFCSDVFMPAPMEQLKVDLTCASVEQFSYGFNENTCF